MAERGQQTAMGVIAARAQATANLERVMPRIIRAADKMLAEIMRAGYVMQEERRDG